MPVEPYVFILLSLCTYRAVRFFVDDSLIGFNVASESEVGEALYRWGKDSDGNDRVWWRARLVDLGSCTYCFGWWLSLTVACLWLWAWPWQLGREGWLTTIALAGAQALLNTLDHRLNH
jgi:hypothetical protein